MKRVNALLNRSVPNKQEPSLTPTETKTFVHKPLDETKSSLRLVTISSELSADGCIQCYVSHSTLDRASYVCLSYRWGPPGDVVRIHINGAPFYIRQNLFEFMDLVRRMPMTFYWIDALCIDQMNSSERSHQVAQMGQIFSGAFLVYLWLGNMPMMKPWMQYLRNERSQQAYRALSWATVVEARETLHTCVFNNDYWRRAWVTQEISLARSVVVVLCRESFKFHELVRSVHRFDNVDLGSFRECEMARFAEFVTDPSNIRSKTLINLLDEFREHECEVPRDRVYSLVSLCSDFQLPEINYDQTCEDLAYDLLKRSDDPVCVCSALLVAQTLGLDSNKDTTPESPTRPSSKTCIDFDLKDLKFARHVMLCNDEIQSWSHYKLVGTDMFGHEHLFSNFCTAFETLMDTLQVHAMKNIVAAPWPLDDMFSAYSDTPSLLRLMDQEHVLAMLSSFGSALTITAHNTYPDISTLQISLQLMVELIPHPIPLCPRVAPQKGKPKPRNSEDLSSPSGRTPSSNRTMPMPTRGSIDLWPQNANFHKIDSMEPGKTQDEEGPVSRMRLSRMESHE